jgi:hypothetical protein
MSTKKLKEDKKIQPFEQGAYKMPPALKLAAERAKKEQPELIAISGRVRYVNLESDR